MVCCYNVHDCFIHLLITLDEKLLIWPTFNLENNITLYIKQSSLIKLTLFFFIFNAVTVTPGQLYIKGKRQAFLWFYSVSILVNFKCVITGHRRFQFCEHI